MTDQSDKVEELRRRARALKERGADVTQWLEDELAKAGDEAGLVAVDVELTRRELDQGKRRNTRWLVGGFWIFVVVVIIAHALTR
ncbi:MAG: hypothetical protein JXQ99_19625 [Hyphomicrobiaceae bacterium]